MLNLIFNVITHYSSYVITNLALHFQQESNHSSIKSSRLKNRTSPSSASSSTSVSQSPRSRHVRKHGNRSDSKSNSSDEDKLKSRSRHRKYSFFLVQQIQYNLY